MHYFLRLSFSDALLEDIPDAPNVLEWSEVALGDEGQIPNCL